MNIYIQQQQLKVGEIEVIAVSSSSNFQIGDNDQVILYGIAEDVPDSIQIGPFPQFSPYYHNHLSSAASYNAPFSRGMNHAARQEKAYEQRHNRLRTATKYR